MKYKIGQRLFSKNYCYDEDDGSDYEIVCVGIFGDGIWKYGVKYDRAEYDCMVDFYTENEIEEEFTTEKEEK